METRFEEEWIDLPGGMPLEATPVLLSPGQYAQGFLRGYTPPSIEGMGGRWVLEHPEEPRFSLPVVVRESELDPALGMGYERHLVVIKCDSGGTGVNVVTGRQYERRRFSLLVLAAPEESEEIAVDEATGEVLDAPVQEQEAVEV